jgi:hypothetical protein
MFSRRINFGKNLFERLLFIFSIGLLLFAIFHIAFTFSEISRHLETNLLVCNEPNHDFGRVTQGVHPECSFIVNNVTNNPITIQKVVPGCGSCVEIIDYSHEPIPANGFGVVKTTLFTDDLERDSVSIRVVL